jgi:hypothetical protein
MALPHFNALPHFGYSLYCSICYKEQSLSDMYRIPDCGCKNKKLINSHTIDYQEVLLKRKLFLRMKKLERIENE